MQLSSHNFVDFCLQTTQSVNEVLRCHHRFDLCHPVPYAGCRHRGDVEQSPFTVADVVLCGRRPPLMTTAHESSRNFTLTGTIFLPVPSHFARIMSSISQYFSSTNHLSCKFLVKAWLASKAFQFNHNVRWLVPLPWRRTQRLLVMHVVFRFILRIFLYAAKQASALNTTGLPKSQPSNVATQIKGHRLSQPN